MRCSVSMALQTFLGLPDERLHSIRNIHLWKTQRPRENGPPCRRVVIALWLVCKFVPCLAFYMNRPI